MNSKNKSYFDLSAVKAYLDGVFSEEEYIKDFSSAASDVYRVYNYKQTVSVKDVEQYLRGLPLGVAFYTSATEKLALSFCPSNRVRKHLIAQGRSLDDIYWWALADAIWTYGAMTKENPQFKKR